MSDDAPGFRALSGFLHLFRADSGTCATAFVGTDRTAALLAWAVAVPGVREAPDVEASNDAVAGPPRVIDLRDAPVGQADDNVPAGRYGWTGLAH
jgi:hypothetical protein